MKRMFVLFSLPILLLFIGAVVLALGSHRVHPPGGLELGRLRPCPGTANCVCSESGTPPEHAVAPFALAGAPEAAWVRLRAVIIEAGGHIERETDEYVWATFRTPVFRFVDDVELRLDHSAGLIQIRSASRVGHFDLGMNRRRVERLRSSVFPSGS